MHPPQLLILESDDAAPGAYGRIGLRHALRRAGLPPSACRVQRLGDFLSREATPASAAGFAAWLITGPATPAASVDEAVERLAALHAPVALTRQLRSGERAAAPGEAVIELDPRTPLEATAAVLAALAQQARPQAALAAERHLLKRQHDGLSKEMSRLNEELRMAMKIQRGFLPDDVPGFGPLSVGVMWRPAGYVGGDLYDVVRLDEHHVGVFVVDAVGHGIPAALMSIYIRQILKQRELTPGRGGGYRLIEPGETLRRLNEHLLDLGHGATALATAVVGVLDTRSGELRVARAGHPLPLLLRRGEPAEVIGPEGPMLGVFACEHFDQQTLRLRDGDRLLLYSDGFELAFPNPERPGDAPGRLRASERYVEEFGTFADAPADEAMQRFRDRLEAETGSLHPPDDLTLVCLAVDGAWGDEAALRAAA
ncbi:PP2C family protein-serine/threonine phosphatase [Phycisphaera mikurensis]|uniref:Putative phosphatase n=1 Tax=Phycisphaera mikurensis (strain NBRC 102666 / KCTC 22515 / FYK2301M01) TaxID=1142394 RepID=I0IFF7_PHYMF|nr:SpoIIE family protein phosphatase [Phycisphaera mikurensis]MBB6440613.1 sigma-B regulation protein RsbU (phosphoserine phosphatase) [Phycisphaera mikurensis]BAM03995.1 putative phosphatase [Phycisphaera mikurensis NBRC 102666]